MNFRMLVISGLLSFLVSCKSTDSGVNGVTETSPTPTAKPYGYDKCIVIEMPLDFGGGPFTRYYQGREILFCCKPCIKNFEQNPKIFMHKLRTWDESGSEQ